MKKLLQSICGAAVCLTLHQQANGQADIVNTPTGGSGHAGTNSSHYLGWDASTQFDLQIRHDAARPITFWTQGAERMHISSNGNIGIGGVPNLSTRLHIRGVNTTVSGGLRPWMIFGTYMSEFDDNMYVGLKRENTATGNSKMDAVINWGDDNSATGGAGPDFMRFIFTGPNTGSAPGTAGNEHGLETMRITPTGLVGIGDFSTWATGTNPNGLPTARLDVAPGGVRLRGLNTDNSLTRVLVTDALGNVSVKTNLTVGGLVSANNGLIAANTNVQLGGNPLIQNTDIPLANFNLALDGQGTPGTNGFLVGLLSTSTFNSSFPLTTNYLFSVTPAKVRIFQDAGQRGSGLHVHTRGQDAIAGVFEGGSIGVHGSAIHNTSSSSQLVHVGVFGEARGQDMRRNIGVQGMATPGTTPPTGSGGGAINSGGWFRATSMLNGNQDFNEGIYAYGMNGMYNMGGRFYATGGADAVYNYAVYGDVSPTSSAIQDNVGIYGRASNLNPANRNWAGFFNGDVNITGALFNLPSDTKFKKDVETLDSALVIINQLNPVSFKYKRNQYPHLNFPKGQQYGLIAQEVKQILPHIVTQTAYPATIDSLGAISNPSEEYKAVNYTELIPYLIKGMQEQQAQIDSLQATLAILTAPTGGTRLSSAQNTTVVELSNKAIVLDQNVPNPFAGRTSIRFVLPDTYSSALMLFHDQNGRLVKSVQLTDKGEGHLDVYAQNLTDGVYTYTLVVDGAVIDSKRMVRQK